MSCTLAHAICLRCAARTDHMADHFRRVHGERWEPRVIGIATIPCPHDGCERSFGSDDALRIHIRTIHKPRDAHSFPCPVSTCSSTFGTATNRDEHVREAHPVPAASPTPPQPITTPGPEELPRIEDPNSVPDSVPDPEEEDSMARRVSCPDCGQKFDTPQGLGPHRAKKHGYRVGDDERPRRQTPAAPAPREDAGGDIASDRSELTEGAGAVGDLLPRLHYITFDQVILHQDEQELLEAAAFLERRDVEVLVARALKAFLEPLRDDEQIRAAAAALHTYRERTEFAQLEVVPA